MKRLNSRLACGTLLALIAWLLLAAASAPTATKEPGKLIILSTTDVKGKTPPAADIPPRGAWPAGSFIDSIRADYPRSLVVDNGGSSRRRTRTGRRWVLMDAMSVGTDAVGLSEKDLRFGLAFARSSRSAPSCDLSAKPVPA